MDYITLNQCIANIKPLISKQDGESFDVKISKLKNNHDFTVPEYCIEKFIKSEMDQQSPGLRGAGRVTDEIPRLGGYLRNCNIHLYEDESIELEMLFKELIYCGYFTHVIFYEDVLKPAEFEDKYKLYQMWIMYILGFDNSTFSQSMAKLEIVSEKNVINLKNKLSKIGLSVTKTEEVILNSILHFYEVAGFALRRREMGIKL